VIIQRNTITEDRNICAFEPAILLNLYMRHCDSTYIYIYIYIYIIFIFYSPRMVEDTG